MEDFIIAEVWAKVNANGDLEAGDCDEVAAERYNSRIDEAGEVPSHLIHLKIKIPKSSFVSNINVEIVKEVTDEDLE